MTDPYRLPRTVVPSRYDLTIEPDLASATFVGRAEIAVTVHEPVTDVVCNSLELELSDASLSDAEGTAVSAVAIAVDDELERATISFDRALEPGDHVLHLVFRGVLNDQLHGFYRSTYTDAETGESHTIATTQFESTDARRAFPCWDEPDLKATFGVTLVVREGLLALTNGPETARESLGDGRVRIRYADTMVMSTYLVAFVVGRLEITEPIDADGVPVRIAHVPGKGHLTAFALEAAAFSLRFFREYYDIAYPDAKVDMIALPDFAQGAMENTGCITYRESLLLADPEHATQPELEDIADVVAHELAHQWFGNLVTMRWWNGIWLNEAFATFMALLVVDAFRPDWEVWVSFSRQTSVAKEVDALHSTRPIEYEVRSPADAQGMFDVLTYQKGGAVLRMLERYLGAKLFRDGIRGYLKAHEHGNTETHDLWDAIEAASGEPVRRIMDSWIWQGGLPLLAVTSSDAGVEVSQSRFFADGSADDTMWDVPLRVRATDGTETSALIGPDPVALAEPPDAVVVANGSSSSFVRVHYDERLLDRMRGHLSDLSAIERYALVDDLWASVASGRASVIDYLELAAGFADEEDVSVWQALLTGLGICDRFVNGEPREAYRAFVRGLVGPSLARLGWDPDAGESDRRRTLRGALLQGMGILGADPGVAAMAREFEAEGRGGGDIDPALAAASVAVVATVGDDDDYERFAQIATGAGTPQEQVRYMMALPLFSDPALLDRTMHSALGGPLRAQDAPFVIGRSIANRDVGDRAWTFAKEHWDELTERFAPTLWVRSVDGVRFLTAPEDVEDAEAFFEAHPIPQSARNLRQMLDRQRILAALGERAAPELAAHFDRA